VLSSRPLTLLIAVAACHPTPSPPPGPPSTAIVGVTVVHPERAGSDAEATDQTIVIRGDRIIAVGPSTTIAVPRGATVVDARGKWAIAGLIDSHVHFFQSADPYTRPDVVDLTAFVPYADEVARNKARLPATFETWLASGVTSVVDTGGPMWNFDVRDAAARSDRAPRVQIAGPLISMVSRQKLELDDPPIIRVDTVDDAKALAAKQIERHADFLKVWFIQTPDRDKANDDAIVKAAADAAHAAGIRLLVHATELDTAKRALRDGADILVHSVFDAPVDDELIALLRERHAILIPTIDVMEDYRLVLSGQWKPLDAETRLGDPEIVATFDQLASLPADKLPERVAKRRADPEPVKLEAVALANLKALWAAGIPIALGTDAGNIGTLHGPGVFREMARMRAAGLDPRQILIAATINGAKVLGLESELGSIDAGKRADLVLLDADPLTDIEHLSHAWRVVRAGRIFDPIVLLREIAATARPVEPAR
jgi:imidazolonepropionase-like amidohydrolase